MNLLYFTPLVVAAAVASSCGDDDDDGFGGSLRSDASVFYYNQITSQGAGDDSGLTVNFSIEGEDDSDSVSGVAYSGEDEGPELRVRIDDANDNQDNSVRLLGEGATGGTLFSTRARLSNNTYYTAVSYGDTSVGRPALGVFAQDQSEVSTGSARFRVINTVDPVILNTFSFDLRYSDADDGQYFATNLQLGDATEYQTTDAGSLNLVVTENRETPEEEIDRVDCSLSGSRTYDVILAVADPLNIPTNVDDADGELVLYCHPQERN